MFSVELDVSSHQRKLKRGSGPGGALMYLLGAETPLWVLVEPH
jgi:hypothetical protein